jgi:hypothetical protein
VKLAQREQSFPLRRLKNTNNAARRRLQLPAAFLSIPLAFTEKFVYSELYVLSEQSPGGSGP